MDTGAFVKDYEGPEKEVEQAVQMAVSEVNSEDPRFIEKEAPPLSEEFPEGSKVFFLGEHAYGVVYTPALVNAPPDGRPLDIPSIDNVHLLDQLGIQFVQIGDDPEATAALKELDDGLEQKHGIQVRRMHDALALDYG